MNDSIISYSAARVRMRTHPLRLSEIPVEHAISLPLPTLRAGRPGYACFAAATRKTPGLPVIQNPPDRWWIYAPNGNHLLLFALTSAIHFADGGDAFSPVELQQPVTTMEDLVSLGKEVEALLDRMAPDFFAGTPAPAGDRSSLSAALSRLLPAPLLPQYHAVAPDFWAWLEVDRG